MALSILDGNQSATTLSTIVTSGQHIPAHTIVSLGTQAVTDISTAVGLLQSAVATQGSVANTAFVKIGGHTGTATTGNIVHVSSVGAMKVDASASTQPITGTVTVGNSLTISSLPAISGTVTVGVLPSLQNSTNFVSVGEQIAEGINNFSTIPVAVNWQDAQQGLGGLFVTATCVTSTNRIGVVTIGGGTVTIGAGTAQIGSVTASISGTVPISISSVTIGNFPATQAISIASVTVGNSVTIGSLPAIAGTVTANIAISSSAITSGVFSSLTSATLVPANTARKMATVYNLGAGQLFVNAGASATTLGGGFMVALSSGDFYECDYTTTTLSAIFATAGTASWVSH